MGVFCCLLLSGNAPHCAHPATACHQEDNRHDMAKTLAKTYDPKTVEPRLSERWQREGVYQFDRASDRPVYAIDTPPATVSGPSAPGPRLFVQPHRFMARFWRMNGHNVFYPMGFDDNGLPTERLVEKRLGVTRNAGGPPGVHRALSGDWARHRRGVSDALAAARSLD